MKITEKQLRKIIREALEEMNEDSLAGEASKKGIENVGKMLHSLGKVDLPGMAKSVKDKMSAVKKEIASVGQGADSDMTKKLEIAVNAVNKLSSDLDLMTDKLSSGFDKLSQYVVPDPWMKDREVARAANQERRGLK